VEVGLGRLVLGGRWRRLGVGIVGLAVLRSAAVGYGETDMIGARGQVGVGGVLVGGASAVTEVPGPRRDAVVVGAPVAEHAGELGAVHVELGLGRLVRGRRGAGRDLLG